MWISLGSGETEKDAQINRTEAQCRQLSQIVTVHHMPILMFFFSCMSTQQLLFSVVTHDVIFFFLEWQYEFEGVKIVGVLEIH